MDHAAVTRRPDADAPAVTAALPGLYGVFLPGYCAPLRWDARGGPPSTSPRWPLAEQATQPRNLLTQPPCPRLSPPRRCRHPEFSSSLTSSLGSDSTIFFSRPSTLSRQRPVGVPGISSPPSCRIMGALLGEPLRSLRLYQAPPPLAYSFAPPLSGRATHLYLAWLHRDELPTSMLPGLVKTSLLVPTPSLHLRTVAGALAN